MVSHKVYLLAHLERLSTSVPFQIRSTARTFLIESFRPANPLPLRKVCWNGLGRIERDLVLALPRNLNATAILLVYRSKRPPTRPPDSLFPARRTTCLAAWTTKSDATIRRQPHRGSAGFTMRQCCWLRLSCLAACAPEFVFSHNCLRAETPASGRMRTMPEQHDLATILPN